MLNPRPLSNSIKMILSCSRVLFQHVTPSLIPGVGIPAVETGAGGAFVDVALAAHARETRRTHAEVMIHPVHAPSAILARARRALVNVQLTQDSCAGRKRTIGHDYRAHNVTRLILMYGHKGFTRKLYNYK